MKLETPAHVLGASSYEVDGNKGGTLWIANKPDQEQPNLAGLEVSKMPCPFEMIDQLKASKQELPATLSLLCEARKGPNLSTKLTVLSWKKAPLAKGS